MWRRCSSKDCKQAVMSTTNRLQANGGSGPTLEYEVK